MNSKKLIEPIFKEWWRKGPIVAPSQQHVKDIELAFYVGAYMMMGLIGKANKNSPDIAKSMVMDMISECRAKILPNQVKFTASIAGEPLDNTRN